ncbi:MAG: hypothetical protein LBR74_00080 [Eubacterium sp.]|jgi:hypothetical protein|nr:hypothetical protein [Eubacterium sp.]
MEVLEAQLEENRSILKAQLKNFASDNIEWQVYFYVKPKNKKPLYTAFSWSASNDELIPNLIDSIVRCSIEELKDDIPVKNYTPNNGKNIIDKTSTDSLLISGNYENLIEALSEAKPYEPGIRKPQGYILIGNNKNNESDKYIIIGIGAPVKTYRHAYFNNAVMTETNPDLIVVKPYWDIFINNTDCYMKGHNSHSFFDLQSFHRHNMEEVRKMLEKPELSQFVENIPPTYPKSGKSIFTDIMSANKIKPIEKEIKRIIDNAVIYPEDKYYGKLIIKESRIDLSDLECYLSFIELLARHYIKEGEIEGEFHPIYD